MAWIFWAITVICLTSGVSTLFYFIGESENENPRVFALIAGLIVFAILSAMTSCFIVGPNI